MISVVCQVNSIGLVDDEILKENAGRYFIGCVLFGLQLNYLPAWPFAQQVGFILICVFIFVIFVILNFSSFSLYLVATV
jgi:hypothetical protein